MRSHSVSVALTSLATLLFAAGCGDPAPAPAPQNTTTPATTGTTPAEPAGEHAHEHGEGPHEGTLADWGGGKYHVEFTVDHDKKEATVYVLGEDAKTTAPIKAKDGKLALSIEDPPIQTDLIAMPQEGDPEGTSSRFVGQHENLGKVQEYAGSISGEFDGTPYSGDFKEEPHEHK